MIAASCSSCSPKELRNGSLPFSFTRFVMQAVIQKSFAGMLPYDLLL